MNRSTIAVNRYWSVVLKWILLVVPVVYGGYLAWQEQVYRQSLRAVPVFAPVSALPVAVPDAFKPDAIATVLGLGAQNTWVQSAEALQLRACFVTNDGTSQALLADTRTARFYSQGERLPGGSVLRRVEVDHVVLWRNGREERLALRPAGKHVLPVSSTDSATPGAGLLHLRPFAEQP